MSFHSSFKIHQLFTDYLLRLPYSELLETHLFRSRANRRLVDCHNDPGPLANEGLSRTHRLWLPHCFRAWMVGLNEEWRWTEVEMEKWKVCLENTVVLVGMAS